MTSRQLIMLKLNEMKNKLKEYRFDSEGRLRMNKNRLRLVDEDNMLHRRSIRWMNKLVWSMKVKIEEDGE